MHLTSLHRIILIGDLSVSHFHPQFLILFSGKFVCKCKIGHRVQDKIRNNVSKYPVIYDLVDLETFLACLFVRYFDQEKLKNWMFFCCTTLDFVAVKKKFAKHKKTNLTIITTT